MTSKKDQFVRAVNALMASTPDRDISQILSIIKAGTEDKSKRKNRCISKFVKRKDALEHLIIRLPNDKDNMNSILSILADICFMSQPACNAVTRFGLLEHMGKILKSRQHEETIMNTCLRLVANLCRDNEQVVKDVVKNESNLNIIESIVHRLWMVLEKNVPSETTLMLSLSSLHEILIIEHPPQKIIDYYGIVKILGYAMVKFIDDWKTSEKNHDSLVRVMQVLELCSKFDYKNICFELKNTGGGDAMLLLSDLIVMPVVSKTVANIVLNLQRLIHYSNLPLDDIYGKIIEKLQDSNAYTNGTDDELYELLLRNFCLLLNAEIIPENLIITATVSLLNALQSHVQPTEASLVNCQMVIATLRLPNFKRCFLLMLDSGILSILSSKLDWFFGIENQLNLYHDVYKYYSESQYQKVFESQFYSNLDTSHAEFNAVRWRRKRKRSLSPRTCSPSLMDYVSGTNNEKEFHEYDDDELDEEEFDEEESDEEELDDEELDNDELDDLSEDVNVLKRELASKIVNLIECFANLKPAALELSTSDIVYKLLLFFLPKNESFKPLDLMPTITNIIITDIIKKPEHLINMLMQTQFVYAVNKLCIPKHRHCRICIDLFEAGYLIMQELTKVVDSTIGKGNIAHNLFTASPTVKQTFVVALPFFSEKMSTLNNLMVKCSGLDVLIDAFRRETVQLGFIIRSLNVLAKKFRIKDPTDCSDKLDFDDEVTTVLEIENYQPNADHIVTFKLDDDSCVQADRELLVSKSDFFNQLLFGQFKESHEEVVRLPETPHDSFKLVLMLLQLDDIATDDNLCRNYGKLLELFSLASVLEAIVLCDRFLLKELYMSLILFVKHCTFLPASVPIIYRWLVDSPVYILRVEIVAYCLVGRMSEEQRNCLFEELLKSENSEQFVDDMKNMFRRFLSASCNHALWSTWTCVQN